jgi:hypothetical protein
VDIWNWIIVVSTLVVIVVGGIALLVGRNPADLSEQEGQPKRQGRHVVDRPAGPGAEAMEAPSSPDRSDPDHP